MINESEITTVKNLINRAWQNGRDYAHDTKTQVDDNCDFINFMGDIEDEINELSEPKKPDTRYKLKLRA